MARLYADENFPLPTVIELRRLGHDVLTIQEDGKANQRYPDIALLSVASAQRRSLLTTNRKHFIRLHLESSEHQGIVVCTFDPDFARQAARISRAIEACESLPGSLIRVNRPA